MLKDRGPNSSQNKHGFGDAEETSCTADSDHDLDLVFRHQVGENLIRIEKYLCGHFFYLIFRGTSLLEICNQLTDAAAAGFQ